MKKVLHLAGAFLREHPVRVLLTSLATMAATCMVIWVASGYDALKRTFDDYAELALGRYTLAIAPISTTNEDGVSVDVVIDLLADPAVAIADPMWARRVTVFSPASAEAQKDQRGPGSGFRAGPGIGPDAHRPQLMLLGTTAPEPPFELASGRWLQASNPPQWEAVVRVDIADNLGVTLDDELLVGEGEHQQRLRIVGLVQAPTLTGAGSYAVMQILTPSSGEIFVPAQLSDQLLEAVAPISLVGVSLKPEADLTRFRFGWGPRLSRYDTPVQFQEAFEIEEALDQSASSENVQMQAYAATGIAMLVGMLVIFCTLSMGVTERIRQFAVLRAIALTRGQVAWLIGLEGLLLATIGLIGGIVLSLCLLFITARLSSRMLDHGVSLGAYSLGLAAISVYGGAILASLLPAYRATRVRPIDAMTLRTANLSVQAVPRWLVGIGICLLMVNPWLTFVTPPSFDVGVLIAMAVSFLAMTIGFVLVSPAIVACVNRWISPLTARLFGIDPKLLASQITSNLWRTVGAAISLAIGLGLYVSIQVWGFTMLEAFIPGPWAPDALLAFQPTPLPYEQALAVAQFEGVDAQRCLPIVVEQPRLLEDLTHSADRASVTRQDNVVIVGLDADPAFQGEYPLFELEWVLGSPATAVPLIQSGRGCVVPDHFLKESGLKLGETFSLVPPEDPDHPVEYVITGAVRLPGWHWQTKMTGFRSRTHRAAALVFADFSTVASDFGMAGANYVWFEYATPQVDVDEITAQAETWYGQILGQTVSAEVARNGGPGVKVMPVANIREMTRGAARRWIWVVSQIPLVALLISSLGVLNVILASVRTRYWEFGVLRSIGFTSGNLVRTVLAEGLLIGVVACVISLGFGIMAGWCGAGIAQYTSFFGGLHPSLVIPWVPISASVVGVLLLATLTAVWPAITVGKTRPLQLLQQGHGSF
ncbi:FtsX-like permease family protein [bacterium]|nr:FtsX-like permease family protein [bacterium]